MMCVRIHACDHHYYAVHSLVKAAAAGDGLPRMFLFGAVLAVLVRLYTLYRGVKVRLTPCWYVRIHTCVHVCIHTCSVCARACTYTAVRPFLRNPFIS